MQGENLLPKNRGLNPQSGKLPLGSYSSPMEIDDVPWVVRELPVVDAKAVGVILYWQPLKRYS